MGGHLAERLLQYLHAPRLSLSRLPLMALVDHRARLLVTAAPGTGSTALIEALVAQRGATEVVGHDRAREVGVDAKHATVGQLVEAGVVEPGHGMRIVTTTRNPYDFYVAEYTRTRTRWVHELRRPDSWVHDVPGAIDRIVDAVTLDFDAWLHGVVGNPGQPLRINRGHVAEADVVLRMEHLEADVRELLGLELPVPPTNVTDRERAYWRSYSVASRRLVATAHAEDLERFGYAF